MYLVAAQEATPRMTFPKGRQTGVSEPHHRYFYTENAMYRSLAEAEKRSVPRI